MERWLEHLNRHPYLPASLLLQAQDDLWLQTLPALHSSDESTESLQAGLMGTRSAVGKPIRWSEHWVAALTEAVGIENSDQDNGLSRERAVLLLVMMERRQLRGLPIHVALANLIWCMP